MRATPTLPNRRSFLATSAAVGAVGLLHDNSAAARDALAATTSKLGEPPMASTDNTAIRPFSFHASEEALVDLRRRIKATNWPEQETVKDTAQGVQLATMQKLAGYWAKDYDWRKVEARLNACRISLPRSTGSPFTSSTCARSMKTRCR